jgi:hypothetical protein
MTIQDVALYRCDRSTTAAAASPCRRALRTRLLDCFVDKRFDTARETGAGLELVIKEHQRPPVVILCCEE